MGKEKDRSNERRDQRGGGSHWRPPQTWLMLEHEPVAASGDGYDLVVTATLSRGHERLIGRELVFRLERTRVAQSTTDGNGQAVQHIPIPPELAGKTVIVEVSLPGTPSRAHITAQVPARETKKNEGFKGVPKWLSVAPRRRGNQIDILIRILDAFVRGVANARLTVVRNGNVEGRDGRRGIGFNPENTKSDSTPLTTDDSGEYVYSFECTKEDPEQEVWIYASGYGRNGYVHTFHYREENEVVVPVDTPQKETLSLAERLDTHDAAHHYNVVRLREHSYDVRDQARNLRRAVFRVPTLPFRMLIAPGTNNKANGILWIATLVLFVIAVYHGAGEALGHRGLTELTKSDPGIVAKQFDDSLNFVLTGSFTKEPAVEVATATWSWWIATGIAFLVSFVHFFVSFWDEVRDAWRAVHERIEQRPALIDLGPPPAEPAPPIEPPPQGKQEKPKMWRRGLGRLAEIFTVSFIADFIFEIGEQLVRKGVRRTA